ncbi:hypothetical protein Tsubulata_004796 [Turnera subulata]|uniref:ABC transporter domain-containing protein n=1 Tax=Turnera subulata TaxID=218843 RepID=A0A9Q0F9X7_9ROSI|nr:hypothetical protein Tsubulata_004796 [Turnera subulata]
MTITPLNLASPYARHLPLKPPASILYRKPAPHLSTTTTTGRTGLFLQKFQFPVKQQRIRYRGFKFPLHLSLTDHPHSLESDRDDENASFLERFRNFSSYIRSILPGGSWWNLRDQKQTEGAAGNPVTVWGALRKMWELLGNDQWIVYVAFGFLVVAAVSEIAMPSILASSIFSAQSGDATAFYGNVRLLLLLCFTSGISSGLRSGCFAIANVILVKRLRERLYSALIFKDITFFDMQEVGGLTSRLGADCQRLSNVIGNNIHLIARNSLQGAGALINLLILSWPLALSSVLICFILSAIFLVYGRYEQWLQRLTFISLRESAANGFWNMGFNMLYRSTQVIAVLLGGMSLATGCLSIEQLTKYILYCEWLIYATWRVVDNASVPILEHFDLSVKANEVIALVGLSGSGKTTLINLLLRLYEPSAGQIYVDGFPLRDLDIRWLKERIGYVEQEPQLFHMDVKSNIAYGCHRVVKMEDIELAAKLAHAHEFISSLPDGYGTLVDDNLLSGGQKQRIAIARAILRDPAILILDEATSALDSESEHFLKGVLEAFKSEKKRERTVIVIAHRLSTVRAADRIIVMDGGRIAEMGGHEELLLNDGLYSQLIKMQGDLLA